MRRRLVRNASASGYAITASTSAPSNEPTVYGQKKGRRIRASLVPEVALIQRQLEQVDDLLTEPRRDPMAGERRADEHRGQRVVGRDDPGQVRVDAEQHRDAVEFSRNAKTMPRIVWKPRNGEKPKKTPSAKAAAVRSGVSSTCSSVPSHRRTSALREMNHRKWLYPAGIGRSPAPSVRAARPPRRPCRRRCASGACRRGRIAAVSLPRVRGRTVKSNS